jgi:hypothetical protein
VNEKRGLSIIYAPAQFMRPNADGTHFYDTTGLAASIVAH